MNLHTSSKPFKGFTILELMVAMTITAIIVGVLVTITGTAIDTWNRSRNELRAARQAEAMISAMSRDLESLVVRGDRPQEWLVATRQTPDGGSTNAARLIFFTAAPDRYDGKIGTDEDLGGDISCAAYELQWRDPVSVSDTSPYKTYALNRLLISPKMPPTTPGGQPRPGAFDMLGSVDLSASFTNMNSGLRSDEDLEALKNFVCENIFQFTMIFHVDVVDVGGVTRTELVSVSPGTKGKTSFRVKHNEIVTLPEQLDLANGVLTAVEVSLTVLTDSAIAQLRADPNLPSRPTFDEWVSANSFNFSRLVQVPRK